MKNSIDDAFVDQILRTTKTIALIGASIKKERPSNSVMQNLLKRGYQVFPVNPGHAGNEILGQNCYSKLSEIPHEIDMVDVFRQSNAVPEIVEQAISSEVKTLWLQLDIRHPEAEEKAKRNGIVVVSERCPNIEFRRQEAVMRSNKSI